ncbi:hypothetical protein LguiA_029344 [Lonicera macranthoides]
MLYLHWDKSENDIINVVEQRIWHSMEEGQFENLPRVHTGLGQMGHKSSKPDLQWSLAVLRSTTLNHSTRVVDRSMGDFRVPCSRHITSPTFIKCITTAFNALESMEKQCQSWSR